MARQLLSSLDDSLHRPFWCNIICRRYMERGRCVDCITTNKILIYVGCHSVVFWCVCHSINFVEWTKQWTGNASKSKIWFSEPIFSLRLMWQWTLNLICSIYTSVSLFAAQIGKRKCTTPCACLCGDFRIVKKEDFVLLLNREFPFDSFYRTKPMVQITHLQLHAITLFGTGFWRFPCMHFCSVPFCRIDLFLLYLKYGRRPKKWWRTLIYSLSFVIYSYNWMTY